MKSRYAARFALLVGCVLGVVSIQDLHAQSKPPASAGHIDSLYIIDCGWSHAADQSRWSPGG
jgi:hypothetical protein